jgi:hypothetical protein
MRYYPELNGLMDDRKKLQTLFANVNVMQADGVNYQKLFKHIVLKFSTKKSILIFSIFSSKIQKSDESQLSKPDLELEGKIIESIKEICAQTKGKRAFQQELILRSQANTIMDLALKSCYTKTDNRLSPRVENVPQLFQLLFDYFDSGFPWDLQKTLDEWIGNQGLAFLETTADVSPYFLKAYLAYSIFEKKDLTHFVDALSRNFASIFKLEALSDSSIDETLIACFCKPKESVTKELRRCFLIHQLVFEQFHGLKGFIQNLSFSHLCECKGIDPSLLSERHDALSLIHSFLKYASSICDLNSRWQLSRRRRDLACGIVDFYNKDVDLLFFKYQVKIGGGFETKNDLIRDFRSLTRHKKLNFFVKDENRQTPRQILNAIKLPKDLKQKFTELLEIREDEDLYRS